MPEPPISPHPKPGISMIGLEWFYLRNFTNEFHNLGFTPVEHNMSRRFCNHVFNFRCTTVFRGPRSTKMTSFGQFTGR